MKRRFRLGLPYWQPSKKLNDDLNDRTQSSKTMALRAVNIFIHAFILVHFFALFFSTNNVKTANFKLRVERMAKIKFHAHAVAEDTSKKLQPYFVNFTEKCGFSNILRETTKQHAVQYTLTICSV